MMLINSREVAAHFGSRWCWSGRNFRLLGYKESPTFLHSLNFINIFFPKFTFWHSISRGSEVGKSVTDFESWLSNSVVHLTLDITVSMTRWEKERMLVQKQRGMWAKQGLWCWWRVSKGKTQLICRRDTSPTSSSSSTSSSSGSSSNFLRFLFFFGNLSWKSHVLLYSF